MKKNIIAGSNNRNSSLHVEREEEVWYTRSRRYFVCRENNPVCYRAGCKSV